MDLGNLFLQIQPLVEQPFSSKETAGAAFREALGEKAVSPGDLMASLLSLELRGLVRQEPGKTFRRLR